MDAYRRVVSLQMQYSGVHGAPDLEATDVDISLSGSNYHRSVDFLLSSPYRLLVTIYA